MPTQSNTLTMTPRPKPLASEESDDPQLTRDTAALCDSMKELIRVYQFRDRDRICHHDVSVTQCYALDMLARFGPITMNELASHLYLDKSTASRVVSTLERKGLLNRLQHPDDRRAVHLTISEAGMDKHDKIASDIQEREKKLIADFSPAVRQSMIELISRLAKAAADRVETAGGSCACRD